MIVRLWGGLGNQLFCYAFGRALSFARGEPLLLEKFDIDGQSSRAYSLGAFNVEPQFTPNPWQYPPQTYREKTFAFDEEAFRQPPGTYFIGHWQTERYFDGWPEELIRREFSLRHVMSDASLDVADQIRAAAHSCSIHVRRGDYLHPETQKVHGVIPREWYAQAMNYVRARHEDAHFFIFSDDPKWCFDHFHDYLRRFTVVNHNGIGSGAKGPSTEHEDLYLMSLCDHAIIANSSFSWWGAWLNPNKSRIVIAPRNWFATDTLNTKDIIPARWVKL